MTKDDMKNGLASVQAELAKIEVAARKLQNQNYADIVASARRRVTQMLEHHDLDAVHAEMDGHPDKNQEPLPFDATAGTSIDNTPKYDSNVRPVPSVNPAEYDPATRPAPDTYRPGDARFDQPNQDFRQPDNVELNAGGTLRQAPNTMGRQDTRK